MKYKLNDENDGHRLRAFRCDNPADLADELDLARLQLEKAINANNQGAATAWATIVQRLAKTHEEAQARRNNFLHRDAVLRLCSQIVEILALEYQSLGIVGWETRLEALAKRMSNTIDGTANTADEVKALT